MVLFPFCTINIRTHIQRHIPTVLQGGGGQQWLDHLLLMTSYLIIIATTSHQTYVEICLRDVHTATENSRSWWKILLEKFKKNLMGGGGGLSTPPLLRPRVKANCHKNTIFIKPNINCPISFSLHVIARKFSLKKKLNNIQLSKVFPSGHCRLHEIRSTSQVPTAGCCLHAVFELCLNYTEDQTTIPRWGTWSLFPFIAIHTAVAIFKHFEHLTKKVNNNP